MNANELFQAGQLQDALEACTAEVKKKPTDAQKRAFLAELLCFAGEYERADKQLDVLGTQQPDAMLPLAMFRQLIRGAKARQEVFQQGRLPEFNAEPAPSQKLQLESLILLREEKVTEAMALVEQAEQARVTIRGTCDGKALDDLRDLDDTIASSLEVITSNGKYYWIAFEQIQSLEFRPPETARDLLWRSASLSVHDGPDGEVHVPVLYEGSFQPDDPQITLGRATQWVGQEGEPIRGLGQRTLLVGEEDRPIMSISNIEIEN